MEINQMPKDPVILLSVVNMKLRDFYPSFEALCEDKQWSGEEIKQILKQINCEYIAEQNQFI